jgi:hypothetical protein
MIKTVTGARMNQNRPQPKPVEVEMVESVP